MKKKIMLPIISGLAIIVLSASTVINSGGTFGWTGSPVDGGPGAGGQCSACHFGGVSIPTCSVTASPAFGGSGASLTYTPGTTYTITVTPGGSYTRYGMNCEIISSQSATLGTYPFGTFVSAVTSNCKIYTTAQTAGYPACVSHTSSSTTTPFQFKWTAPASGTGYLYADVLGVNGNIATSGDRVSAVTSFTLTPANVGIASHNINSGGLSVFPNPAIDNVRLTYTLEERGQVVAKLYNINGESVAELANEMQNAGPQAIDARLPLNLAKGVYMVKLSINGKQVSQKLMIN